LRLAPLRGQGRRQDFEDGGDYGAAPPQDGDDLVTKVKEMQRNDTTAKEQWWAFCDTHGGGIHDPAKHDADFIQRFLLQYTQGIRFEPTPPQTTNNTQLAELFKEGQRKSSNWKNAWAQYCQHYGGGVHDPGKHEIGFLVNFLDFLGQRGTLALSMMSSMMGGGFQMAQPMGQPMGQPPMGQPNYMAVPPAKRARVGETEKDSLVMRVKSYQRSGEEAKQLWWSHCDNQLGGVRDPARHDSVTLQQFITAYKLP